MQQINVPNFVVEHNLPSVQWA